MFKPLTYRQQESLWAYIFVLPAVLGFLLLVVFPLSFGFWTSLTDWSALSAPKYIGFGNYARLLTITEPRWFPNTILNSFFFVVMGPVGIAFSLFLATLVNTDIYFSKLFRGIFFLPAITSAAIVAVVWSWMYDTNFGLVNWALSWFGVLPVPWLQSERWAKMAIWLMLTWQGAGAGMMIQLSALQGISDEVIEAAIVDGAGAVRRFFSIILPLLTPVLFFQVVTISIGAFQLFGPILMMTSGDQNTETAVFYIFRYAFRQSQWGFATAGSYALALIIAVFSMLQFFGQKKWVFYG